MLTKSAEFEAIISRETQEGGHGSSELHTTEAEAALGERAM